MSAPATSAYKILTASQMAALEASGGFAGAPIDLADGYIHLSTAAQIDETVERHFPDREDLYVAVVDLAALADVVRWEFSRGGDLFPHIYGTLPMSTVLAYAPLKYDESGRVILPASD